MVVALTSCTGAVEPHVLKAGSYDLVATVDHIYSNGVGGMVAAPGQLRGVLELSGADSAGRPNNVKFTLDSCEGFQACYTGLNPQFGRPKYLPVYFRADGSVVVTAGNSNDEELIFTGGAGNQLVGDFSFANRTWAYPYASGTLMLHLR